MHNELNRVEKKPSQQWIQGLETGQLVAVNAVSASAPGLVPVVDGCTRSSILRSEMAWGDSGGGWLPGGACVEPFWLRMHGPGFCLQFFCLYSVHYIGLECARCI